MNEPSIAPQFKKMAGQHHPYSSATLYSNQEANIRGGAKSFTSFLNICQEACCRKGWGQAFPLTYRFYFLVDIYLKTTLPLFSSPAVPSWQQPMSSPEGLYRGDGPCWLLKLINGGSKSTNERGPSLVGSLGLKNTRVTGKVDVFSKMARNRLAQ